MKIIIVPDLHFGAKSFGKDYPDKLNSRIQDQIYLMEFIFEKAKQLKIDKMILVGDVFDKEHPEPILISTFFKWLTKCVELFSVDIIMGNHDYKRSGNTTISILDAITAARIKNCKIYKKIEAVTIDDLSIIYIPYFDKKEFSFETNKEATKFLVNEIKDKIKECKSKKKISVGHLALEHSIYVGDEVVDDHNEIFIPTSTFNDCDYTWFGHIHNPQILSKKPFVAHIGSVDKKTFSDGDKFICLYDSDKNNYKDIKLPCRNLVDIIITVPSDIKDTNSFIKDEIQKISDDQFTESIVRVKIEIEANDSEPVDKKELNKILYSKNIQHITDMIEKKRVGAIEIKTEIDETTDPYKAVDMFLPLVDADESFKKEVAIICKEIISDIWGK